MSARLCLNMIVRNEERIILRCLESVVAQISCWVICDTGSTDRTPAMIEDFFRAHRLPGELHRTRFIDFEQARNDALQRARQSALGFDYMLLSDADMELEVVEPGFREGLSAPGYAVQQRSSYSYWNVRLLRREVSARYVGATHEYLAVEGGTARLQGVRFIDHAEGASRGEKFTRDIALLERDLAQRPGHARSLFYLAQSYRDMGRWAEAAEAYRQRIARGGWAEEAWYARLQLARCLLRQDDAGGFLREALTAWSERPHRAEPLYDLARHHRLRGEHAPSVLFALAGLKVGWPAGDSLFVEDWVYQHGLMEELSIAGFYVPEHRARAELACDALALRHDVPQGVRNLARRNQRYYATRLSSRLASFEATQMHFPAPAGYHAMNPSVVSWNDAIWMVQRTVNYTLSSAGIYATADGGPVRTRNFLVRLSPALGAETVSEIMLPPDLPAAYPSVLGFEDVRPFVWQGMLWATATVRQLNPEGWCETVLARIAPGADGVSRFVDWRVIRPERPRQHEKNWMPASSGSEVQFIYSLEPARMLGPDGAELGCHTGRWAAEHLHGGSQALRFALGWLAICHERVVSGRARTYLHRFVWLDGSGALRRMSLPFTLTGAAVEFVAGLAWSLDRTQLLISFGVADGESWLGRCAAADVPKLLKRPDRAWAAAR